jgi:hypothetical protein
VRLKLIRNAAGDVVGTHVVRERSPGGIQAGMVVPEGSTAEEIDIPDELMLLSAAELHRKLAELTRGADRGRD